MTVLTGHDCARGIVVVEVSNRDGRINIRYDHPDRVSDDLLNKRVHGQAEDGKKGSKLRKVSVRGQHPAWKSLQSCNIHASGAHEQLQTPPHSSTGLVKGLDVFEDAGLFEP